MALLPLGAYDRKDDNKINNTDDLACRALRYKPSLSPQVHDVLFSYWRLPRSVQQRFTHELPSIHIAIPDTNDDGVSSSVHVDWHCLSAIFQATKHDAADANAMEIAWAFALQCEAAVATAGLLDFSSTGGTRTHIVTASTASAAALRLADKTHGDELPRIAALLDDSSGEFYMALLVLLTVFERALYDLYHEYELALRCTSISNNSSKESIASQSQPYPTKRKKNLILRDLLQSEPLARALPPGFLQLLTVLFLPSGLNLRNLLWHGFVAPAHVPKSVGCLLLVLLLALPQQRSVSQQTVAATTANEAASIDCQVVRAPLFAASAFDNRFVGLSPALHHTLAKLFHGSDSESPLESESSLESESEEIYTYRNLLLEAANLCATSSFVPRGRRNLVQRAFDRFMDTGDELQWLFALLPVLEHALRLRFVAVNSAAYGISDAYSTAQIDAYYSTLDGFGQRDKHQVLLHPRVVFEHSGDSSGNSDSITDIEETATPAARRVLNALYTTLPPAALAVCLDLFLMAAGPGLRGKLCHGEADLSMLLLPAISTSASHRYDPHSISTATQLLVLAWLSLCRASVTTVSVADDGSTDASTDTTTLALSVQLQESIDAFEIGYESSFHPFYQLRRALVAVDARAAAFAILQTSWTRMQIERIDASTLWLAFPAGSSDVDAIKDSDTDSRCAADATSVGGFGVREDARRVEALAALLMRRCYHVEGDDSAPLFAWTTRSTDVYALVANAAAALATQNTRRSKSFAALLTRLLDALDVTHVQLDAHTASCCRPESLHVNQTLDLPGVNMAVDAEAASSPFESLRQLTPHLLALSDDDDESESTTTNALRSAACMLATLAAIERSYAGVTMRLGTLQQLVATGAARTNHRRSFLQSVFVLPAVAAVLMLCRRLVAHQVVQLEALAAHRAAACRPPSASLRLQSPPTCPSALSYALVQPKLLQFATALKRCVGSGGTTGDPNATVAAEGGSASQNLEKALLLACEFVESKALRAVVRVECRHQ